MPAQSARTLLICLLGLSLGLVVLGVMVGSTGFSWQALAFKVLERNAHADAPDAQMAANMAWQILWDIRLPRSLGALLCGALLGLAGAVAQGLFRNPLADPYLLGASSGAGLGVAACLVALGAAPTMAAWATQLGLTGAAFLGALAAMVLTLLLARGVEQSLRLLLAGVIVGVVLGAATSALTLFQPEVLRPMQAFVLGHTGYLSWASVGVLGPVWVICLGVALGLSRALDALTLGESTARSLGVGLLPIRLWLIATLALATATAVAQAGLIGFVGLVAPHLVRGRARGQHVQVLLLSSLAGGVLLLGADVLARALAAPQELPVGLLTASLGGAYLLWRLHRRPHALQQPPQNSGAAP
jgi:iron complex transport system permease protein